MAEHHSITSGNPATQPPDFLTISDPYGNPVQVHRLLAEQAAATGQAVLVPISADACRAALAGRSSDPRDRFGELDGLIADILAEHGRTDGPDIVRILDTDHDHITDVQGVRNRFRPGMPLRDAGYTGGRGGYAAPE